MISSDTVAVSSQLECIRLRGVRQNNLKGFDLDVPLGKYIVVTGLSGAGKSSLVFDTLHAEGQRRYVETFSAYTRQFLDLLDKPKVDSIENIRPSIAIEQTPKYWRRFHDTGERTMERRGDRELVGRLDNWGVVDSVLCRELVGYMSRTLELLGAREVMFDHPRCRARGEPTCEFRARWRQKKDAPWGDADSAHAARLRDASGPIEIVAHGAPVDKVSDRH